MPRVIVRYWAAIRAAAGCAEEAVDAATLADALMAVRRIRPDNDRFTAVLRLCSMVVDGRPVGQRDPSGVELTDGSVVEVLPPFAGG